MKNQIRRAAIFTGMCLGFLGLTDAGNLHAEPQKRSNSTISGVVLGPDDKPVAHAGITYQSSGGNAPHALFTDAKGHFAITKLRADNYDLRASAKGVFSEWEKNVNVRPGQTKEITLRLIYAKQMPKAYGAGKPKP
jgi:Carboxypeptidase regulatory-like domain